MTKLEKIILETILPPTIEDITELIAIAINQIESSGMVFLTGSSAKSIGTSYRVFANPPKFFMYDTHPEPTEIFKCYSEVSGILELIANEICTATSTNDRKWKFIKYGSYLRIRK